jgi:hypothetical protein
MKRHALIASTAAVVGLAIWALAQAPASGSRPLAALTPPGALFYLEAKDFGALLSDWNSSPEKRAWLTGENYQVFSRSRLFFRLQQSQQEFAAAAGVPPDLALVSGIAGSNSALAIYDIGQLQLLYITRLPGAKSAESALWKKRGDYQTRTAAGVQYFLKEDPQSHKVAAFAAAQDLLLLATREDLLTGALALLAGQGNPPLAQERWFDDAVKAAGAPHDLRMAMNFERLVVSPYFRSYWIQGNITEMRQYGSAIADVERATGEIRESRVMLRRQPAPDRTPAEAASGQLIRLVPAEAGLYRAWAAPATNRVLGLVEHKLLAPGNDARTNSNQAPIVQLGDGVTGSEEDLETRIDELPLTDEKGSPAMEAFQKVLDANHSTALLEAGGASALPGGVFVGGGTAIALLGSADWDGAAVRSALTQAAANVWTTSSLGAGWTSHTAASHEYFELDGLARLATAVNGRVLILSDSSALLTAMLGRLSAPAGQASVYASVYQHAREFPLYQRLTRLIDFPNGAAGGPLFFSGNVGSIGRTMARLDSASLVAHDNGAAVRESVVYRWRR